MIYVARTKGEPALAATAMREAVRAVDPNQPLTEMESMEEMIGRRLAGPRVTVQVLGFLAGLALLLAGVGIYGVLSYLTSQRAREFGIRVAMGAVRADIVTLVLRRGVVLTGAGLAAGCGVAYAVTPLVGSLLSGVEPHDTSTFLGATGALLAAGAMACVFPVMRALMTDPVKVLREE
jgi:ABC-type antimicrobial peptide transport system permease subunit